MSKIIGVGELVKMTGLARNTINKYVDKGYIRGIVNPVNKYRYFKDDEVLEDLRKLGFINGGKNDKQTK
jgi:DNA-binding transcriptional MerR regulator